MASLQSLPAAAALPPGRQALVLLLLAAAAGLGRLAARMARRPAAAAEPQREIVALAGPEGGRAAAVYEDGRLIGVIEGIDRL